MGLYTPLDMNGLRSLPPNREVSGSISGLVEGRLFG